MFEIFDFLFSLSPIELLFLFSSVFCFLLFLFIPFHFISIIESERRKEEHKENNRISEEQKND